MLVEKLTKFRRIGWNGIQLTIPDNWEAHLGGHNHLIFEKDFSPLFEIRWQKSRKKKSSRAQAVFKQIKRTATALHEKDLPLQWSFLKNRYHVTCYSKLNNLHFDTGVCVCKQCQTLLLFQLSNREKKTEQLLIDCLKSLSCHCTADDSILWSLQDFQLKLPSNYSLIDSSFAPGLTRISFRNRYIVLHTCKLGPADVRLNSQPLEEILRSLTDISDLPIQFGEDNNSCMGHRAPAIGRQLIFRFKRLKPFIQAEIHHDTVNNRLLAIVLESLRPIPPETSESIYNNYEIIQT